MKIFSFKNDYSEGCHPKILDALVKANFDQQEGYGDDEYSLQARSLIRQHIGNLDADIHFVSGGTQANLIVAAAILRPHESIISAETGHVHVHEAGAIEATGHKINLIRSSDGKIRPDQIQAVLDEHITIPHMVKPKLVYISNSTEIGTVYRKKELEDLSSYCKSRSLYLFLDGARLGSALSAEGNDLTLADVCALTDVFYIGGTKNGALLGEAIVIRHDGMKEDFGYHLKQRGALLSKGRLLGIQFLELFRDDLYFALAKHANAMAMKIALGVARSGYDSLTDSITNQIFPILPNTLIETLEQHYGFYVWQKIDTTTSAIRLVTSWATPEEMVDRFIDDLNRYGLYLKRN